MPAQVVIATFTIPSAARPSEFNSNVDYDFSIARANRPVAAADHASPAICMLFPWWHCIRHGNALFVLLQSDTPAEQSLSQSLLRVVRLDATSGAMQLQKDVDVPAAYSAWGDEGSNHFQWNSAHLVLTGNAKLALDHDHQTSFTVRMNDDLIPSR